MKPMMLVGVMLLSGCGPVALARYVAERGQAQKTMAQNLPLVDAQCQRIEENYRASYDRYDKQSAVAAGNRWFAEKKECEEKIRAKRLAAQEKANQEAVKRQEEMALGTVQNQSPDTSSSDDATAGEDPEEKPICKRYRALLAEDRLIPLRASNGNRSGPPLSDLVKAACASEDPEPCANFKRLVAHDPMYQPRLDSCEQSIKESREQGAAYLEREYAKIEANISARQANEASIVAKEQADAKMVEEAKTVAETFEAAIENNPKAVRFLISAEWCYWSANRRAVKAKLAEESKYSAEFGVVNLRTIDDLKWEARKSDEGMNDAMARLAQLGLKRAPCSERMLNVLTSCVVKEAACDFDRQEALAVLREMKLVK